MMKLNKSQLAAIEYTGQNIIVFASAGGGKTTVLVERLLKRILVDHISLANIVAMTFTEAAASNMAKRLEKRLRDLLKENPADDFLNNQIALLPEAKISTIHSFCLDIIKEYYYLVGLQKTALNNILDEGHRNILLENAINEALKEEKDLIDLDNLLENSYFNRSALIKAIKDIIEKALATADPYAWLNSFNLPEIKEFKDIPDIYQEEYLNGIKDLLKQARGYLYQLINIESPDQNNYLTIYEKIDPLLAEDDLLNFLHQINYLLTPIPRASSKKYDAKERAKKLRMNFIEIFKKIAINIDKPANILKNYNLTLPYKRRIIKICSKTLEYFQDYKKTANVIDFADIEHYAYAILNKNDCAIAKKLKTHYKEIMVDEFQDTSSAQWAILSLLANNDLFLVGDVKQSIYRFRNAKPSIMENLKKDPDFHLIHIRNNYRSKANIVEYNNFLFNKLMNIAENDFKEEDAQVADLEQQKLANSPIKFIKVKADKTDNTARQKILRAQALALEIIQDHKAGTAYKDMAILVRSHSEKNELRKILTAYKIPFFMRENTGYFTSKALDCLLAYLKVLNNSKDQIALYATLSSPIYKLNDDQLFELEKPFEYPAFQKDFLALLPLAKKNNLAELVNKILALHNFYNNLLEEEKNNLSYFLFRFENYDFANLTDMIDFIETSKESQKDSASGISADAPVVKIMTIHGSKGLEFDNIYLLSNHQNKDINKTANIALDEELGFSFSIPINKYAKAEDIVKKAIIMKNNREDLKEYVRFLYVALTRAKKQLTIVDALSTENEYGDDLSLLLARKGFTSFFLKYSQNNLLTVKEIQIDEDIPFINRAAKQKTALPHGNYDIKSIKQLAPSSLEKHSLKLDFNAIYGMEYGTAMHAVLEKIDYHHPRNREIIKQIDSSLNEHQIDAILSFSEDVRIKNLNPDNIYQEFSFYYKEKENLVHGFMDFVYIGEDILLVDYKTDIGIDLNEFHNRYDAQIKTYINALETMYPNKDIKAYIYSLDLASFIDMS